MRHRFYRRYGKRLLDLGLAAVAMVLLALPMLVIAGVVRATSPGPALFWQRRVGARKVYFMMPKFRTMRTDTPHDVPTHLLRDPERYITPVGRFLRRTSLDELPEAFNILKGDMSIIGERDIIVTTKKNIVFSRVVAANSVSL